MSGVETIPVWAAIVVSFFVLAGALLTLIGAIGLARLETFYNRLHAPALGASGGVILISIGSMIAFILQGGWVAHELLIIAFMTMTTPITLMLLGHAALHRDRAEGNDTIPDQEKNGLENLRANTHLPSNTNAD
ncbi:cation:proton antiporter [Rhizobium sp. CFBP 8762]|uniref:monovalent cation/H(+) antiporter subunit G n=1 Tax=Rhizobium sp. CFBP 8762 TaxID=2775279 RepID=UPI001782672B|nr:monovalent cation/H(+) antiporter subunit G [Rhizobium sp. CFBP 8762]MBD8554650.1 cation:proton antiporter [Rhizobium sp. CFBP 8762]